jgi:hypothetical protein
VIPKITPTQRCLDSCNKYQAPLQFIRLHTTPEMLLNLPNPLGAMVVKCLEEEETLSGHAVEHEKREFYDSPVNEGTQWAVLTNGAIRDILAIRSSCRMLRDVVRCHRRDFFRIDRCLLQLRRRIATAESWARRRCFGHSIRSMHSRKSREMCVSAGS